MKSNLFLRVISVLLAVLFIGHTADARVNPPAAQLWAEQNGKLLLDTFQEPDIAKRYQVLDKLLLQYVDLPYIGKFLMGKYWRTMTTAQQTEYQELFRRYALALYKTFPLDFANQLSYDFGQAYEDGSFTIVPAAIHLNLGDKPQDLLMQFRLHGTDTDIKLVDIKLAESSLILSYRSRFYQMIADNDGEIEWFLENLQSLADSMEQLNSDAASSL